MKKYIIPTILVLNIIATTYAVVTLRQRMATAEQALTEAGQIFGESRIVQKSPEGEIVINQVVTIADVQKAQEVPQMGI